MPAIGPVRLPVGRTRFCTARARSQAPRLVITCVSSHNASQAAKAVLAAGLVAGGASIALVAPDLHSLQLSKLQHGFGGLSQESVSQLAGEAGARVLGHGGASKQAAALVNGPGLQLHFLADKLQPTPGHGSSTETSKAAHGTSPPVVPAASHNPSPHHKPLWPLEGGDVAGLVATSAATALAAGGGVGGGSLLVPIYILVLGFPMGAAVALSNVTIFGGALVNAAFNFGARHPFKDAPLVDWDLALVMEPSTILGALAGTYINHVLPPWVTTLALSALLGCLTSKLLQRGSACYAKESAQLLQEAAAEQATVPASLVHSSGVSSLGSSRGRIARPRPMGTGSWGGVATPGSRAYMPDAPSCPLPIYPASLAVSSFAVRAESSQQVLLPSHTGARTAGATWASYSSGSSMDGGSSSGSSNNIIPCRGAPLVPASAPCRHPTPSVGWPSPSSGELYCASPDDNLSALAVLHDPADRPFQQPHRGASSTAWPAANVGSTPQPAADEGSAARPAGDAGSKGGWVLDVPLGKFGVLLGLLAGVAATDTLRSHLPCPSSAYWLAAGSMAPVTLLVLAGVRHHLLTQPQQQAKQQQQQQDTSANEMCSPLLSSSGSGDSSLQGASAAKVDGVVWDEETTVVYPAVCTFVGMLAGMFGVGGGIIKAPLMLELGVTPAVASATSATMILFTSAAASVASASFGAVQWDYAAALFSCALVSTAIGQLATKQLVQRLGGRSSVIVYAMAAVLGASAVVLGVQGGMVTSEAFDQHTAWVWGSVCGAAPL